MNIRDLFTHKKFISRKRMRENYLRDPVFNEIMKSDPKLKQILDRPDEMRELHRRMREETRDGKLNRDDMQRIAYDLAHGKGRDISSLEGRQIAREFFPDSTRRYKHDELSAAVKSSASVPKSPDKKTKIESVGKAGKVPPAYLAYRPKPVSASSDSGDDGDKKTSYFDSMRKTLSNRGK